MREIITQICLITVFCGLLKMLFPDGKNKKQMNFILSCVFLVSMLKLFFGRDFEIIPENIKISDSGQYIDFSDAIVERQKNAIASSLNEKAREILSAYKIIPENISVFVNITDGYIISISEMRIKVPDNVKEKSIEILREYLGEDIILSTE